ncbi:3-dehydroquinate synthase [Mucilaginibacter aquatilis]|uniref:3-dehydroquinate synthase n=1 Tax=Mucilaginibacter aquatilis TaxID=1517760 RepID=A0A6I4I6U8_9SPHI|nr:3-dehydroquinate synthase [Mucilaginibacter aquatilis]MVN89858.1 3-dehydroquinate synthase [Mucilaginibacter aquatilis]
MDTIKSIDYPVFFNDTLTQLVNLIEKGNYSRFFILTDEHTGEHCLPLLQSHLEHLNDKYDVIEVSAGEESKNIDFCSGIWKMLIDFGADRHSLMINLGGGVIGDMGGFAASTYKRGIDFVQVPTTLLSQVDASVGGKTGIDFDNLKNIIGTFTQPKAVFIEPTFLQTLPQRQILSGYAEMLKHGLIQDAVYWNQLKEQGISNGAPAPELIHRSVAIKNNVVVNDPFEKGFRKCLNFGHTVGHAVETYSLQNDDGKHITHGEAVAIGMICEAWLSHKKAGLSAEELSEIATVLNNLYPKYDLDESCYTLLHSLMKTDKKNQNGFVNCTLLNKIGECSIDHICTEEELCDSLRYYATL